MTDERLDESPSTGYTAGLTQGRLRFQQCLECSKSVFYPRVVCPHCGSDRLQWRDSEGLGVVYSTTTTRSRSGDYNVALIDLDEGYRMMCAVEDEFEGDVRIGDRVSAVVAPGTTMETLSFRRIEQS